MNLRAAVLAIALALVSASAQARTSPNVMGAQPRDLFAGATTSAAVAPLAQAPNSAQAIVPVPLPAGAEQVDSTYYDLQDMGSLGPRIVVGTDNIIHVAYQKDFCELGGGCPPNVLAPDPFPNRAMGYAFRTAGVWNHPGKVADPRLHCSQCVPELVGGFGTISQSPNGAIAIAAHMNEDGCGRRGDMYLEDGAGSSSWSGYLTPIPQPPADPDYLEFPQVSANANGSFTVMGESPRTGAYDGVTALRVSYLAAPGGAFTCPVGWQFGAWKSITTPSLFPHSTLTTPPSFGFPSIAHSSNGRVGVAVADIGGNIHLIESSNGSFATGTLTTRTLTNYSDATIIAADSTSSQFRPYIHCHVAYNDTTPNVVWSELQARKVGGVIQSFDWHSRIMHWDPIRGAEVVKQVAQGEADQYDNVDRGLKGPLPGLNTITVDWPQVGFSANGVETYVAWLRFVDAEVDTSAHINLAGICTGVGYGDVAASVARAGQPWSSPQNLTSTPATDERFFSLATYNTASKAHIVFQAASTNQGGDNILGDRGNTDRTHPPLVLLRRIAYLERTLSASTVGVDLPESRLFASSLFASPNPSPSGVRFAFRDGVAAGTRVAVDIYSVSGRHISRVLSGPHGSLEWNGRDTSGQRAMAGVYFARVTGGTGAQPVRFTLLQ